MEPSPAWQVFRYHEETKHHPHRLARSPGSMDWATQPQPFRTYEGVTPVLLPLLGNDPVGRHQDLYDRSGHGAWDITLESVGAFLELSLGLSAWKSIPEGHRWALRMNPSSGNLHPTEAHLLLPTMEGAGRIQDAAGTRVEAGLFHYQPYAHALEPRAELPSGFSARLQSHFQSPGFLMGLSSISWREAWKYGERALRYCHHDTGHALAALSFAGNLLGWKVTYLNALSTEEVESVLGFPQMTWPSLEEEHGHLLAWVSPAQTSAIPRGLPSDILQAVRTLTVKGAPSVLSPDHVEWTLLRETEGLLSKPRTQETSVRFEASPLICESASRLSAAQILRQRRSAVAFDGVTAITRRTFFSILDKTLPRPGRAPFDVELDGPRIHLVIFVHQVEELEQGLYIWVRDPSAPKDLKRGFRREFSWEAIAEAPGLYRLRSGDFRNTAAQISCGQAIAGDSAFSLGMLAHFRPVIDRDPWRYPQLFWEAGLIGQVLYLEAEAHGLRGTGIGCFFDDTVHDLLGLRNNEYQSLYHFTVGGPVEDLRLETRPPYGHLPADRR